MRRGPRILYRRLLTCPKMGQTCGNLSIMALGFVTRTWLYSTTTSGAEQRLDNDQKVRERFRELKGNSDPRCQLLVKCLKAGMIWAGSSYVHFLAFGTDSLLDFLSARAPAPADGPSLVT